MKIFFSLFLILLTFSFANAQDLPIPKSPLMTKLEADVSSGKLNAVDDFWKFAKLRGTPLIEPIEDDSKDSLVTFIWRGDSDTKNVLVQSPFFPWVMARRQMTQVKNTDVWYKTAKVPNDARVTYRFTINDPRLPFADPYDWFSIKVSFLNDPLNVRKFIYPKDEDVLGDEVGEVSLLEMPVALKSSALIERANIKKGKLEKTNYKSEILPDERRLWFYTPPDYSPKKKYPLVIFLDGFEYLNSIPSKIILDNLIADGKIPPVVAVFIATPIEAGVREKEYYANPLFVDFMVKEFLPLVQAKYRVSKKATDTTVVGLSASGFAGGFLALKHPEKFGNVIMQSPAVFWGNDYYGEDGEWLTNEYVIAPKIKVRFYLEMGKFEAYAPTGKGIPNAFHSVRHFRDVLKLKGNEVYYNEFNGAHEMINWRETLPDALIKIVGK
ncbi:MAG TPA: alpha/beta hydrolase-fold protein [Pyrinomonadaceae bacterium]|nr:alpha/beta hydrolase-fold protein [Pyrinomonadaceae bacterium]